MDNEQIKQMLLKLENTDLDFTVVMTGKESTRVNGLYKPETREILLHNKNFKTDNELVYTAIHEYTHHLINADDVRETGGKFISKGAKIHTTAFWSRFHQLLDVAQEKGIYVIDIDASPELKELTEEIRKNYLEVNGKLMQDFGKLLSKAHTLCQKANIRYEDYVDRVLRLPRTAARDITRVGLVPVNPAVGFENMKKIASIKKPEDRNAAEQQIMSGKAPDTVRELMKQKASGDDPKIKLEKEKNRLSKTIEALQQRLQYVEESLASM
jgi:hypothetical protein